MSPGHTQRADTLSMTILAFSATAGVLVEFYIGDLVGAVGIEPGRPSDSQ